MSYETIIPKIIPNKEILTQITEAQVCAWMAAKLEEVREMIPAHNINVAAHFLEHRDGPYYFHWGMHAADKCVTCESDTYTCVRLLREKINDKPRERAAEARRKAQALLDEAAQIEAILTPPVGNPTSLEAPCGVDGGTEAGGVNLAPNPTPNRAVEPAPAVRSI